MSASTLYCPECGSSDVDVEHNVSELEAKCLTCGHVCDITDLDTIDTREDRPLMPDLLTPTITEIRRELDQAAGVAEEACRAYADHLLNDGSPYIGMFRGPFEKAGPYLMRLDAAHRAETGRPVNPFSPHSLSAEAHYAFDLLYRADWTPAADVNAALNAQFQRSGARQIEPLFPAHVLRDAGAGYRLEKGKVGSRVAYRIVDAPAAS